MEQWFCRIRPVGRVLDLGFSSSFARSVDILLIIDDDDDLIARKIKIKIKRSRYWQRPRPATVEYYVTCDTKLCHKGKRGNIIEQ